MSGEINNVISFGSVGTGDVGDWASLTQEALTTRQYANYADIIEMMAMANVGTSAINAVAGGCPYVTYPSLTVARMAIPFYIAVSRIDLQFSLGCYEGDSVTTPQIINRQCEYDVEVTSRSTRLPFVVETGTNIRKITPSFDNVGNIVDAEYSVVGSELICSREDCWGVVRLTGIAKLYRAELTREFEASIDNKYTDLKAMVSVEYNGGKRVLDLEVPDCVEGALLVCEGEGDQGPTGVYFLGGMLDVQRTVYYNGCNGEFIKEC